MELQLSPKGQALFFSVFALAALLFVLFNSYSVLTYREHSTVVPAQIVKKRIWLPCDLQYTKLNGQQAFKRFIWAIAKASRQP
ncbi:MAG: hypothetical protein FWC42_10695 [Proteobacteria bacterium]|nr:hypothetical protein [Pseudomonadota bacterium]